MLSGPSSGILLSSLQSELGTESHESFRRPWRQCLYSPFSAISSASKLDGKLHCDCVSVTIAVLKW